MKKITNPFSHLLFTLVVFILGAGVLLAGYRCFYQAAYPLRYQEVVEENSVRSGMEEAVLYAVIRTESSFQPDAESSVGALGLMQITPDTLSWVRYRLGEPGAVDARTVLLDPEQNIFYGSQTLALLLEEFGTLENALAAYHAGWGNVTRWLADSQYSSDGKTLTTIPFGDTRAYVSKVMETAETYRRLYHFS
ncbi:lytic transglycosylase domain-containing protein [Angelakisella massiliensis]|uniref:lytic transglycosylase domain-containing protein n=1 Tax=Angelakisella massiliensis TaxID=1871018 RepID=UPI0008F8FB1D|nr:lytic transglycosylase domain-containing protein [Angelakisella massiliensis]